MILSTCYDLNLRSLQGVGTGAACRIHVVALLLQKHAQLQQTAIVIYLISISGTPGRRLKTAYTQRRHSSQPYKAEIIPRGRHLCCLPPLERFYQQLALWNQCVASVATTTSTHLTSVLHVNKNSHNVVDRRTTKRHESAISLCLLSLTNFFV